MNKKLVALASFLLVGALLAGCGGTRASHYYQLSALRNEPRPDGNPVRYPVTLLVTSFQTSHLYREDRIVYGSKGEEMGLYQYERWTEPPSEMLRDIILRNLRNSGRFKEVHSLRSSARGDFILRGHLYDLKEMDMDKVLVARVTFEAELMDTKTRNTVWTHAYTHDEPVASKNVAAVVAALDRNVQAGVADLATSLEQYFAARPPEANSTGEN
jgi:ABC-type uncharacterized transport system auxiliary subunit